ncbi:MAG TPA: hypothetical protein PK122_06555 [Candidatus Paceibacterota bacterium]|nr:hypothetical protein [Candidatus Paceibacterota bacterium]
MKKCELCGEEFNPPKTNLKKKFCSDKCVQKNKSIFQKKYKNSEEGKRKNSEAQKIAQNRPEVKAQKSKTLKEIANKPEVKEKFQKWSKEFHNREDIKESTSKWTKNFQKNNPGVLKKFHERTKEYYEKEYPFDEIARENRSESTKKLFQNLEHKNRISKILSEKWKDSNFADYMFSRRHNYKDFKFPSGRIIRIQGYENIALNELLKKYLEEDIFVGVKEIKKEIGEIWYSKEGKPHKYFPDIFIKSINTIFEVKSNFTFNQKKEINLLKRDACLKKGINFEFLIY